MSKRFGKVCVIGLGYVGLPIAAVLAKHGVEVIGVDVDAERVASINSCTAPITEAGLAATMLDTVSTGTLRAQDRPVSADAFIIAVPTPLTNDYAPDLSYVRAAAKSFAPMLNSGNLIIFESTLTIGATEGLCELLAEMRNDLSFPNQCGETSDIRVAYCPERVLPGRILSELVQNERVVGGVTAACSADAAELYRIFLKADCHVTTARSAELVKLTENAYRDVNIAFANEISVVCKALGVNPWEIRDLANLHPRVNLLEPGPGVGGHCIPIDPWFIVHSRPDDTPLVQTARRVNGHQPNRVVEEIITTCERLEAPTIACLGLTYKADVEDMRESPAIAVVQQMRKALTERIMVVEPYVDSLPDELAGTGGLELVDLDTALDNADVVVLLTGHQEFRDIDRKRLSSKKVIDTRGIWWKKQC